MSKQPIPTPVVLQNHELRLQRIEAAISLEDDKTVSQLSVVPPQSSVKSVSQGAQSQRSGGSSSSRTAELARRRAGVGAESAAAGGAATGSATSGAGAVPVPVPAVPSFDYLRGRVLTSVAESSSSHSVISAPAGDFVGGEEFAEVRTQLGDVDARTMDLRTEVDGMAKSLMLVSRENIELRQDIRRIDGQRVQLEAEVAKLQKMVEDILAKSQ